MAASSFRMTLMIPAKALAPQSREAGPYITSIRSIIPSGYCREIQLDCFQTSFCTTPSQISRKRSVFSLRIPLMKMVDHSTPIPLLKSKPGRSLRISSRSM